MIRNAIHTERLKLIPATVNDLEPYCRAIYCNAKVMATLPARVALAMDVAVPRARANLLETWLEHGFGPWLVLDKGSQVILGHCGLRYWPGTQDVEVLYALTPDVWGLGYATEAARAAIAEGFSALALERIIAGVFPENAVSASVLNKLGMVRWKEAEFDGVRINMYQLHRRDWRAG